MSEVFQGCDDQQLKKLQYLAELCGYESRVYEARSVRCVHVKIRDRWVYWNPLYVSGNDWQDVLRAMLNRGEVTIRLKPSPHRQAGQPLFVCEVKTPEITINGASVSSASMSQFIGDLITSTLCEAAAFSMPRQEISNQTT